MESLAQIKSKLSTTEEAVADAVETCYPGIARSYRALYHLRGREVANAYLWIEFHFLIRDEIEKPKHTPAL